MVKQLEPGYRLLQIGEIVRLGDYVQIGYGFFPVAESNYVGDIINNLGTFSRIWSKRP